MLLICWLINFIVAFERRSVSIDRIANIIFATIVQIPYS